jgi:hypothetical protein
MIEIGCPPTFIFVPCTSSLSPLLLRGFPTLYRKPHAPTAAMLPRCAASPFPRPLPRHRIVAALARPSACNALLHSYVASDTSIAHDLADMAENPRTVVAV